MFVNLIKQEGILGVFFSFFFSFSFILSFVLFFPPGYLFLGGSFDVDDTKRRILTIRAAWDKRKIVWGECAYLITPFHDCLRSQHWEDAIPILV
jgi:hypothetical protein